MNKRFVGVLVFAFVVASVASILLYRLMANRQPASAAAPATVKVIVAARNLEVGTLIKDADIRVADWPGAIPSGALVKREDLIARGVVAPIYANEPILESRLAPKGAGGGLAATIPKGWRAVAVRVNDVIGVAGFVVPGMHVDILVSGTPPGGTGNLGTLTKTLLQNVEVLSAAQEFRKDAEGKPIMAQVINVLVTPEDAEKLSLASSQAQIQMVLRNPLDQERTSTPGTAMAHLFTGGVLRKGAIKTDNDENAAPPPRRRPAPVTHPVVAPPVRAEVVEQPKKPFVMEIIAGARKTETKFDRVPEAKP